MARPPIGLQLGRCPRGPQDSNRARASGRKSATTEKKKTAWQASLSIAEETIGAAFHSAAACRYLSASVPRGAAAEAPGDGAVVGRMGARRSKGENDTFQHVMDGRNGERLHFLVTAQTNQVAREGARVLERACFRETTGDPKNARQAGMTSAASNFLPDVTAACAVSARHSCDAAAVRSFTLSTHSFTLSCCGQRLSPWTMPHDPEIFRNEELQK
jgi:hypothetical protein